MVTLTPTELAGIRADALVGLFDQARVRRNQGGGWFDVHPSIQGRMRLATTRTEVGLTEASEDPGAAAVVSLPVGADVRRRDRITIGGRTMVVTVVQPDTQVHVQAFGRLEAENG